MVKTERLRRSFFPQAIRLLNSNSVWVSTCLNLINSKYIIKISTILHHPYCCYVYTLYNLFAHSSCTSLLIPESAASNKLSTRQLPAPIFLSDLVWLNYDFVFTFRFRIRTWKTWKSHGILKQQSPSLYRFGKINKPRKFWKSHENLFQKPHNRIMFNYVLNFSAVLHIYHITHSRSFQL